MGVPARPAGMAPRAINPDGLFDPTERAYTHARVEGGTLYMSGQVGRDADGTVAAGDIRAQARQALDNVGTVLAAVDREYGDVAKVTTYFTDIEAHLAPYKDVWTAYFDQPYPAHTAIGVEALANPDLLLEVEAETPLDD